MTDAQARAYAFDHYAKRSAESSFASPGVTIASRHVPVMLALRGDARDPEFLRAAHAALALALPVRPNTVAGNERDRALWLGPDEWLLVSCGDGLMRADLRFTGASVADVSHGRAVLRLSGPDVRVMLAKICPLDLDARQFGVDACAQTAMARVNVILDHVKPGVFELYCPRSYAGSFWHSVVEAAAEYGCDIAPSGNM